MQHLCECCAQVSRVCMRSLCLSACILLCPCFGKESAPTRCRQGQPGLTTHSQSWHRVARSTSLDATAQASKVRVELTRSKPLTNYGKDHGPCAPSLLILLTPFTSRRRRSRRRCRLTFVGAAGREKLVQDVKLEAVQVNVRVARRVEAAEAPERGSARLLELES